MHNKDKVILDKKLPYEHNTCLYILEEIHRLTNLGILTKERTNLQKSVPSKTPSERAKEIIGKLKALPYDFDDVKTSISNQSSEER